LLLCGTLLCLSRIVLAQTHPIPTTQGSALRAELETAANDLNWLAIDDVLYERRARDEVPSAAAEYAKLDRVLAPARDPGEMVSLLSHPDAKVRTLAIALLYHHHRRV
jgi:hypothetical protein